MDGCGKWGPPTGKAFRVTPNILVTAQTPSSQFASSWGEMVAVVSRLHRSKLYPNPMLQSALPQSVP